ncbi:MAG TPA: hypothetical protein VF320_05535 [Acidimicrobiales bacterium]
MPTSARSPAPSDGPGTRELWTWFEPVHAVTYFAPECIDALAATGLRGVWMGYFAARAAPLGPVGPATATALFFSFHPSRAARALPDAWGFADPGSVLAARRTGAAAALRRLLPTVGDEAPALLPLVDRMVEAADGSGRALFSANRSLDPGGDPVGALWQGCTSLREHRGDGHVSALVAAGLDGCEALVLFAASEGTPAALLRVTRGWSEDEWRAAEDRLHDRGLLDTGSITPSGRDLRNSVEGLTDQLASEPLRTLTAGEQVVLAAGLRRVAAAVVDQEVIPFPNPMGLPAPG